MPADPNGSFLITATLAPDRQHSHLVLSGDVDMTALPVLADAVTQIAGAAPQTIVVDLAAVTYGGSTLANFLAGIHSAAPRGAVLLLCRPTPMIETVLRVTNMAEIATIRHDSCT